MTYHIAFVHRTVIAGGALEGMWAVEETFTCMFVLDMCIEVVLKIAAVST